MPLSYLLLTFILSGQGFGPLSKSLSQLACRTAAASACEEVDDCPILEQGQAEPDFHPEAHLDIGITVSQTLALLVPWPFGVVGDMLEHLDVEDWSHQGNLLAQPGLAKVLIEYELLQFETIILGRRAEADAFFVEPVHHL